MNALITIIISMSVPSAVTAFCFWLLERKIMKIEALQEEKDKARKENEVIIIEGIGASIGLSEATAKAVERIPDAHCNGDMHNALEYATHIKRKHKAFITEQGVEALY